MQQPPPLTIGQLTHLLQLEPSTIHPDAGEYLNHPPPFIPPIPTYQIPPQQREAWIASLNKIRIASRAQLVDILDPHLPTIVLHQLVTHVGTIRNNQQRQVVSALPLLNWSSLTTPIHIGQSPQTITDIIRQRFDRIGTTYTTHQNTFHLHNISALSLNHNDPRGLQPATIHWKLPQLITR